MAEIKYPFQIFSCKRETKVLSADAKFSLPTEDESPLSMHAGWSRVVLTIINKETTPTVAPYANIRAEDIPYLFYRTEMVLETALKNEITRTTTSQTSKSTSASYTGVVIKLGKYKGKSIPEILKMPDGETALLEVRKICEENVAKYPSNKTVIQAIDAGIKDLKEGNLQAASTEGGSSVIYVYRENYKPLANKKNSDGLIFNYAIEIGRDMTKDKSPWFVTIVNGYAPEKGSINPSTAVKCSFFMTDKEWYGMIHSMMSTKNNFETCHFRKQEDKVKAITEQFFKK